jgi:hypothetical protein
VGMLSYFSFYITDFSLINITITNFLCTLCSNIAFSMLYILMCRLSFCVVHSKVNCGSDFLLKLFCLSFLWFLGCADL